MTDTDPDVEQIVRRRLLERSGAERLIMGSQMFEAAKAMILASFPKNLTPIEIRLRLCERLYEGEIDMGAVRAHLLGLPQNES